MGSEIREGIVVGGRTIHVRQSARDLGMDPSVLCKILNGTTPAGSISVGRAAALARHFEFPSIEAFLDAVSARRDRSGHSPRSCTASA